MLNKKILQLYNAFKPIQVDLYEIDSSSDLVNWKLSDFQAYFYKSNHENSINSLIKCILPYDYLFKMRNRAKNSLQTIARSYLGVDKIIPSYNVEVLNKINNLYFKYNDTRKRN